MGEVQGDSQESSCNYFSALTLFGNARVARPGGALTLEMQRQIDPDILGAAESRSSSVTNQTISSERMRRHSQAASVERRLFVGDAVVPLSGSQHRA
jgi:hypothetical protein